MLKRMKVVDADDREDAIDVSSPHVDSEEEELMRMRYFEALRRQQFEEHMRQQAAYYQMAQGRSDKSGAPFRTPNVPTFNYEEFLSYESDMNTASANYRPRNSNTCLRRKNVNASRPSAQANPGGGAPRPLRSSMKKTQKSDKDQASAKMDPAEDSFHVSPLHSQKYEEAKAEAAPAEDREVDRRPSKPTSNAEDRVTLSGASEFDYLGGSEEPEEEEDDNAQDATKKSLEKDFEEAARLEAEREEEAARYEAEREAKLRDDERRLREQGPSALTDTMFDRIIVPRFEDEEPPVRDDARRRSSLKQPRPFVEVRRPSKIVSFRTPQEAIAVQREEDYKYRLQYNLESKLDRRRYADYCPGEGSPGSAFHTPVRSRRNHSALIRD